MAARWSKDSAPILVEALGPDDFLDAALPEPPSEFVSRIVIPEVEGLFAMKKLGTTIAISIAIFAR